MTATTAPGTPVSARQAPRRNPLAFAGPSTGALVALVLLVVLNALFTPNFASTGNLLNILWQASAVVLVGVGMTWVIATGGVDLSVGSVMAIAGALAATQFHRGWFMAGLIGLAGALVVGAVNGLLVARNNVQPIVVTLATLIAGRGLAQVLSNDGELVPISNAVALEMGRGRLLGVPIPVLVALVVVVVAAVVLRSTPFGRWVLAAGGNAPAARLAGVPVQRTLLLVYMASGLLAGIAGLLEASRLGASDGAKIGLNIELDAIAATVIGGTALTGGRATIIGTVIGALVMQVIATSFNMLLVPYAWSLVLKAAIILVAVYFQRPKRV